MPTGRTTEDAEHENAVAVTSPIEITSKSRTFFMNLVISNTNAGEIADKW